MTTYQEIIERKKNGLALDKSQIFSFAEAVYKNFWPDYQIAALLMAMRVNGLSDQEILWLTQAMVRYSAKLKLNHRKAFAVDKHSTGGVGDGISLVLMPLAASLGFSVPTMSGRSLGLTGGTLDKLDAIAGIRSRLKPAVINRQISRIGLAMFGQSDSMAPVDRKLYALRDAISAVDCQGLVVSSIMSKKLIEDLDGIVFDVKVGRGAIFNDLKDAKRLAKKLVWVAKKNSLKAAAVITSMEEPLGAAVGNGLEVAQALAILEGNTDPLWDDFVEVTLELLARLLILFGKANDRGAAIAMCRQALNSGAALKKFELMIVAQGVAKNAALNLKRHLPKAKKTFSVVSAREGWVSFVDAKKIARATRYLRALRRTQEDRVDLSAGVILKKKTGDFVKKGEILGELHASWASTQDCKMAERLFKDAYSFSRSKTHKRKMLLDVIR